MDSAADQPLTAGATPDASIRLAFGALMLVTLLASLDQTIVSTALPTIVGELGGLEHLSWIVTAYMLAQTIATPLYGKLGDLFGRKVILQSAIVLFLLGSVLAGLSRSMGELIAFRGLQGLGGGGLVVSTMAAVADIIPPRDRGRYQGYFGAVYGVSTVLGPLIGGFFVEQLSWRWIFYINIPLGLVAFFVINVSMPSRGRSGTRPKIDIPGALLMAILLLALVLFTSLGGVSYAWTSLEMLFLVAVAFTALVLFLIVEHRSDEPLLPLRLFRNSTFVVSCVVGFIVSLALFGSTTYLPVYLQVVKGVSPATAGLQLTPMMGGVLITSILGGQYISRSGHYRMLPITGTALMAVGLALLATLGPASGTWAASAYALLLGLGIGMVMQVLVIAVQNTVDYRDLGVATSGAALFRLTGGSVGVALFGAIFAANLSRGLAERLPAGTHVAQGVSVEVLASMPDRVRALYLDVFTAALQPVFWLAAILAAVAFLLSWLLKEAPLAAKSGSDTLADSFAMPHDATSLEELEAIVSRMGQQENRWETYRRIAAHSGVLLPPDQMWLLSHLCGGERPLVVTELSMRFAVGRSQVDAAACALAAKGYAAAQIGDAYTATAAGRAAYETIVDAYRERAAAFVQRWSPDDHAEVRAMLTRVARDLVSGLPIDPAEAEP